MNLKILNTKLMIYNSEKGQSLIELIIAIGLSTLLLPALIIGLIASQNGKPQQQERLQAVALLKEAQEAVRVVRESEWTSFAVDGTYHPVNSGSTWSLSFGPETINGFTRQIVISDVYRNQSGTIVNTGGTVDPSTKQVVSTVSWNTPLNSSVSTTSYFTRYINNAVFTDTTVNDFNSGISNNTAVTNVSGGEVVLGSTQNGDWCKPQNFVVNQLSLPKLSNAIFAKQAGAYLGSGDGTNSPAFINVSINTPLPPATPSASVAGTYTGTFTTNSINSDGHYVYLATTNNPQIIILDLTTNPYSRIGTVTVPGGLPANSVYLYGNILFVTSGNYLYTFDVTTPSGPHTTVKSSIQMIAGFWSQPTARQVVVVNNKAYVGTGNSLLGLQSFTFNSDGSNLKLYAATLLTFSQQSQGLFVDPTGTYAYMAFNNASGWSFTKGLVVINLTNPIQILFWKFYLTFNTYNTGLMDPRGITVPGNNRAIVVGVAGSSNPGNEQYQVVDTSNINNLTYCGGYVVSSGIYGVSSILDQYNNAYSYIISGDTGAQFKIILGGVGGGGYATYGTFTSRIFDATRSAMFNRFSATIARPLQTTIQFQVASAPLVSNSCANASFTYVGPSGSASAYFVPSNNNSIAFPIPIGNYNPGYQNPAECFRYKVFFNTSDITQSPVLYDATVNYSP